MKLREKKRILKITETNSKVIKPLILCLLFVVDLKN